MSTTVNSTLDNVMRRVLNDPDIFFIKYRIFDPNEWQDLKTRFQNNDLAGVNMKIDDKISSLRREYQSERDRQRKTSIQEAGELTNALKESITKKPHIINQMFSTLDHFGLVKCNLPNMEDYGKVIENHNFPLVEEFFLYKIDKANRFERAALKKIFEYVKELYDMKQDVVEIAFFVRKVESLKRFAEMVKNE